MRLLIPTEFRADIWLAHWARAQGSVLLRNQDIGLGWQCLQMDLHLLLLMLPVNYLPHLSHLSDLKLFFSEPLVNGEVGEVSCSACSSGHISLSSFCHSSVRIWVPGHNSSSWLWPPKLCQILPISLAAAVFPKGCPSGAKEIYWDPSSNAITWVFCLHCTFLSSSSALKLQLLYGDSYFHTTSVFFGEFIIAVYAFQ